MIRRLGPGDEDVLALIAREDADFDLDERSHPRDALPPADARAFLEQALVWIDEREGAVAGFLSAQVIRKRVGAPREILLYEIGVRGAFRRRGVGRGLVEALLGWMRAEAISEVWVLADNPGATAFYEACGLRVAPFQPVYLTREQ